MNSYNKLLLLRRSIFRIFHLRGRNYSMAVNNDNNSARDHGGWHYCSTSAFSNSNVNGWKNTNCNQDHSQQQHFCTTTTSDNTSSSADQNTLSKLPDAIEQQCGKWTRMVRAEWEADNAKYVWHGKRLKCTNVVYGLKSSRISLSTEDLNLGQLRSLNQFFQIGDTVELKLKRVPQQSNSIGPLDNLLLSGVVNKTFDGGIVITVNRYFNDRERHSLQQCSFDIKRNEKPAKLENQLNFLAKRHSDWHKWPGFAALLKTFKCQQLVEDTGLDPVDCNHGKDLDPSQCQALSAVLNLKRPIVAVHGPPGSGKTRLLVEYLHILSRQGKKVLVCSKTNAGLYHLLDTFCKKFPSAASSKGTFLCLKRFDAQVASKVIANGTLERLIEKKFFVKLTRNDMDAEMRKHYESTQTLKAAMANKQDYSGEEDLKREAEDLFKEMRETGFQQNEKTTRDLLQSNSTLFMTQSNAFLNFFTRTGLTFDVVVFDDAVLFNEFDSWMMALSTAPVLRLFGDYNQPGIPVNSSISRGLEFDKSLLQRLDEEFGPDVNFHLRRQYRSNAAIQAWPNRAFYGQRAAEPDESVRNIRLDDLLEEGKSAPKELITDPLVLVDLGKLEGEWREWMFKAEKGGKSWFNWGEAFLTAFHLWKLFEHIPRLNPSKIAYSTLYDAQRITLRNIFSALSGLHFNNLKQIRMEHNKNLHGQHFDVVLKDSVTVPLPKLFTDPFFLKHLNNEMCRARRQLIWFGNSKWLEQGSEQSRQLLQTFQIHGRIIGPNQLMPLEQGQFQKMTMEVQDNFRKMQEQRTRTNNRTIARKW